MYNEFGKKPKFTLVTVIAVAAVMLVAATTEMAITGYVFAYSRNQATSAANDCGNGEIPTNIGCQNSDSQIQGDENSAAITSQQTFPSGPPSPPEPTGFSVTGTGTGIMGEDEGQTITCTQTGTNPVGAILNLEFSAQSDGTVSGTYTIDSPNSGPERDGTITDGTTDGSTFSLTGEGSSICFAQPQTGEVTISGDCGDDVTITYEDTGASGTFTGDVECTLT
jgi:hypothetical protein